MDVFDDFKNNLLFTQKSTTISLCVLLTDILPGIISMCLSATAKFLFLFRNTSLTTRGAGGFYRNLYCKIFTFEEEKRILQVKIQILQKSDFRLQQIKPGAAGRVERRLYYDKSKK